MDIDEEDEEEGPIDLSWPDNTAERIFYVIKAPLLYIMFFTTPDVRRPVSPLFAGCFKGSTVSDQLS